MKPKKNALKFTFWMFAFYFLNTSLLCWFSGQAFDDLGFYISFLVLDAIALFYVIRIIMKPHIVKDNTSHAPTAILSVAVVVCVTLLTTLHDPVEIMEIIYLFIYLSSMAFLIYWYKKSGIVEPKMPKPDSLIYDDYNQVIINQPIKPKSQIDNLIDTLKEALLIDQNNPKDYQELKETLNLALAIKEREIEAPNNIISQMTNIINSYISLSTNIVKTQKVEEALVKIRESIPIINRGLAAIFDSDVEQNLIKLEVETKTLENLLTLSGLNNKNSINIKNND